MGFIPLDPFFLPNEIKVKKHIYDKIISMIRLNNGEVNNFALYIPKNDQVLGSIGSYVRLQLSNDFKKEILIYEVGGTNNLTIIQHTNRFMEIELDLSDDGLYPIGWWLWELYLSPNDDGVNYTKVNEGRMYVEEGVLGEVDEYIYAGLDSPTSVYTGLDTDSVVQLTFWNSGSATTTLWNNANETWN